MGKRNRARTRAIRTEMTQTGQNYTRAAAAVAVSPLDGSVRGGTDAVVEHVKRLLRAQLAADDARYARVEQLEQQGHRVIDGGQTSQTGWNISDWRTDEVIAEGDDGYAGYVATSKRLDPDGRWIHIDVIDDDDDEPLPPVVTPGVPPSLAKALDDWTGLMSTPDEEIAEFIGWSVDEVHEHR